jgi:hypothetical protein
MCFKLNRNVQTALQKRRLQHFVLRQPCLNIERCGKGKLFFSFDGKSSLTAHYFPFVKKEILSFRKRKFPSFNFCHSALWYGFLSL